MPFGGSFCFSDEEFFLPTKLEVFCTSLCWLSQQFTSVLQILATWIISSSAFLLPLIFKREQARSRISSVTIVIAKPNENKVEKALVWPPGSQCLTPGVGMRNADFSTAWEASNTSLHQNCWTDRTLRSSQKINSYFPATASFLLKLENEPKTPKQCVWPLLLAARALGTPIALLPGHPCAPFPSLAAPHLLAACPHLVVDPQCGATFPITKLIPGMATSLHLLGNSS